MINILVNTGWTAGLAVMGWEHYDWLLTDSACGITNQQGVVEITDTGE